MTERLYYTDPNLTEFDARVVSVTGAGIVLDRTAFYPTSGGQLFDTGSLEANGQNLRVTDVIESESGEILHLIEAPAPAPGTPVRGLVDRERRRGHMQQHTGQHLLSAVFIALFDAPTVSFHMGDESCTIDLDIKSLSDGQLRQAERRANEIVTEDVPVDIRCATPDEARQMGVRKIPPGITDKLRLIEIRGHDLTACGGTHVGRTGQVGPILLRKSEKVKQGMRVEFVCGLRAVAAARRDFEILTSAAALFSAHIYDLPAQIRKALDDAKAAGKQRHKLEEEIAQLMASRLLAETPGQSGIRLVVRSLADRELPFVKLLAQKLTAQPGVVALLAAAGAQPALVFAQSAGGRFDMGALMKEAMSALGGRGGGSSDLAQGGVPAGADLEAALARAAEALGFRL